MDKSDHRPSIQTILNGTNYLAWSQAMCSFLKGQKTWCYVTDVFTILTQQKDETREKFQDRLEE